MDSQDIAALLEEGLARPAGRTSLAEAEAHARALVSFMRGAPGVERVEIAGSCRRRKETVGDLDLVVASRDPGAAAARLLAYPDVRQVIAKGRTRCVIVVSSGLPVDLRIVRPEVYGAALHCFTGSKAHGLGVTTLGVKRGLKISEYGVFGEGKRIGGAEEDDVFGAVGLAWIPPELREDRGEIEAARAGALPELVELADIRGDLHVHTSYGDGRDRVEAMVEACRARGHEYVALTDRARALGAAGGARMGEQAREIEAVRKKKRGITVLRGVEVDVLEDGRLELDDATLAEVDLVIAAVHSALDMPGPEMTARLLRALANPRVHVLAHPTGRLLGRRAPCAADMAQVIRTARDRGVLLEINAQPERLDLPDVLVRMARDEGAKVVVCSDAHAVSELDGLRHGVDQARRGWCAAGDVANTQTVDELAAWLQKRSRTRLKAGPGRARSAAVVAERNRPAAAAARHRR